MLKKNGKYEIEITDLNNLGFGVGRVDGTVVFVSGAVDGEVVRAHVIYVCKDYAVAKAEQILTPSPHRASVPFCDFSACGGCAYRDVHYSHERDLKRQRVYQSFRKSGLPDAIVHPLDSTGVTEHYRNKAQYPVSLDRDGRCIAGFFAPKSHRVVEASDCPLQRREFSSIVKSLCQFFDENEIKPYDEKTHTGVVRHIYLRSSCEGDCMLTLVINSRSMPKEEKLVEHLQKNHPNVKSFFININEKKTNVICSDEYTLVYGEGYIRDVLCGVALEISPASFYQINHDVAEMIYKKARELAQFSGDECLLDLYCGTGSIGLSMADAVRELVGIEVVPDAVECAKRNARANGIENAHFFCADASDAENIISTAEKQYSKKISPDVVILDPPRKGSTPELLTYLSDIDCKRIVYISCNPDTLARDAKLLCELGYSMGDVYIYDMFPKTGHVESVVCLTRSDKAT